MFTQIVFMTMDVVDEAEIKFWPKTIYISASDLIPDCRYAAEEGTRSASSAICTRLTSKTYSDCLKENRRRPVDEQPSSFSSTYLMLALIIWYETMKVVDGIY